MITDESVPLGAQVAERDLGLARRSINEEEHRVLVHLMRGAGRDGAVLVYGDSGTRKSLTGSVGTPLSFVGDGDVLLICLRYVFRVLTRPPLA